MNQPPVILIHGIMGSRLVDTQSGKEVWFGSLSKLVFSDYREVALDIDPVSLEPLPSTLAPSGLADQLAGKDFYGNITRTLERAGRYKRAICAVFPAHSEPRVNAVIARIHQGQKDRFRPLNPGCPGINAQCVPDFSPCAQ